MASSRRITLDDTDPAIQYEGAWEAVQGSFAVEGEIFGEAYRSTLHGTRGPKASFSLSFDGSSIAVIGRNDPHVEDSTVTDPEIVCRVDGVSIPVQLRPPYARNNWPFCEWNGVEGRPHELTVEVTVSSQKTFWLDQIRYTPSPGSRLASNPTVYVPRGDPMFKLGPDWGPILDFVNITSIPGSEATVDFEGTSLAWYGYIPGEHRGTPSSGEFSVDNGPATTFHMQGPPDEGDSNQSAYSFFEHKFFETGRLPDGPHKLFVRFNGPENATPITLGYVYITNGRIEGVGAEGGQGRPTDVSGSSTSAPPLGSLHEGTMATSRMDHATDLTLSHTAATGEGPGPLITVYITGPNGLSTPISTSIAATVAAAEQTDKIQSPIGAIVGGALGGLALVILAIIGVYFVYHRRRQQAPLRASTSSATGVVYSPFVHPQPSWHHTSGNNNHSDDTGPAYRKGETPPQASLTGSAPLTMSSASVSSGPSSNLNALGSSRFIAHSDSGLRLGSSGEVIREIPPTYTAG